MKTTSLLLTGGHSQPHRPGRLQADRTLREGSVPQSAVAALVVSAACGLGCYLYYRTLEFFLDVVWRKIPETYVADVWPAWSYGLYIPLVGLGTCLLLGCTVTALGEPGDLAYTIDCVHKRAFVPLDHVAPMVLASLVGIVGGGSLGPEAPLVAICAALGGNISFYVFQQTNKNVMRKHTLMGMVSGNMFPRVAIARSNAECIVSVTSLYLISCASRAC